MKKWLFTPLLLLLAGCAMAPVVQNTESPGSNPQSPKKETALDLPDLGPAPELQNDFWLNADEPLRLANLRGKVVLLDMWTFGCINCRNVVPSLREWHKDYQDQGLVVIGNHYPEFSYEQDLELVKQAMIELDITYAVAQDNDRLTWSAYNNRYWPTLYLIDKNGNLRYKHIGEGAYAETEAAIVALLNESYP
jgi:thiol-disulfide isomerase/thioredoxin